MLYALRHPVALLGLVLGFLAGCVVHGLLQAFVASRLGDRAPLAAGRGRVDLRRHLDPFGAVAAALGGVGWAAPVTLDRRRLWRRGRLVAVALAGPVANAALGVAALAAFVAIGGVPQLLAYVDVGSVLHGAAGGLPAGQAFVLSFAIENLAMALLSVVPLPPLEGAQVMFALAPRTHGWQLAEHRLVEQNWGVGILLLLLILPLTGGQAPLVYVLGAIIDPLLGLAA